MVAWPIAPFPQLPLQAGYSESPPDTVIRSPMDAGPAKLRRRTTAGVRRLACALRLTTAQVATFDSFYVTSLQGGALPFDWVNPRTGAAESLRFVGPPAYGAPSGDLFPVTFKLEVLP